MTLAERTKPKHIILTAVAISALVFICTIVAYYKDSLLHIDGNIDKDYFPAFGTFISSTIGVILSGTSMILIYFTYLSQQRLISEQTKVFNRDYIKYKDGIRPLIELKFIGHPNGYSGAFTLTVKENSAFSIQVLNETIIPVALIPSVINMPYFNKDNPLKFTYNRGPENPIPYGLNGEFKLKVSYEDFLHNRYEQTFSSAFEQVIFVSTAPKNIVGVNEPIQLN